MEGPHVRPGRRAGDHGGLRRAAAAGRPTSATTTLFDATVESIEREISAEISRRITEFNVAIDFLGSRDTVDHRQFAEFMDRREDKRSEPIAGDPGLTVSERTTDAEALQARERAAGREFELFAAIPARDEERLIITHVERDVQILGRSFVGFDVTNFQGILDSPEESDDGVVVAVTPLRNLLGLFQLGTTDVDIEFEDAVLYLISAYSTADGRDSGLATRVESVADIVSSVEDSVPDGYHLLASLPDERLPIVAIERRTDPSIHHEAQLTVVGLSRNEEVDLSPLEIRLVASNEIHDSSQGLYSPRVWIWGLVGSLLAAAFAGTRSHQARRLADTGVELELAQTMASTDALTGLLNRQGLVDAVENPHPRPGVLLFLDLDNFKRVNDEDGHASGDLVLRRIGEALRAAVRIDDVVCRLGGDEFLLFLPNPIDDDRIADICTIIVTAVDAIDPRISCSIGTARRTSDHPLSIDTLVRKADAAMYDEKRSKQGARR